MVFAARACVLCCACAPEALIPVHMAQVLHCASELWNAGLEDPTMQNNIREKSKGLGREADLKSDVVWIWTVAHSIVFTGR